MSKSLNEAKVIGNLTRDPELKYTQGGTAIAKFGVATNRSWTTKDGQKQEAVDFHNIVAWGKLGEICDQILSKGSKVYISGRMQTTKWQDKEGRDRYSFEIVASDMLALSSNRRNDEPVGRQATEEDVKVGEPEGMKENPPESETTEAEDVSDDIPF